MILFWGSGPEAVEEKHTNVTDDNIQGVYSRDCRSGLTTTLLNEKTAFICLFK
jgi:hypothetical protein